MPNEERLRALLSNLGRSTLRGVRKCPKCGTYNGTRGLSCKNKACDVVFKEAGEKKKQSMEVCKLDTGTSTQVFSVRVRDKGPDYRGFVQLPVVSESAYLSQVSALCFVESCQRLFNTNILKCHEREEGVVAVTCQHIQSALRCCASATPLLISHAALSSLAISPQIRQGVWELATETPGPLVQRVSKTIMAVKCKVTTKHPLGFLHVSFFNSPPKPHFACTCSAFKSQSKMGGLQGSGDSKNCVHYYACIAALASDSKLSEEFSALVERERIQDNPPSPPPSHSLGEDEELERLLGEEADVDPTAFLSKDLVLTHPVTQQELEVIEGLVDVAQELEPQPEPALLPKLIKGKGGKRRKEMDPNGCPPPRKKLGKRDPLKKHFKFSEGKIDVSKVELSFIEWLASVTERINQTMHFQFDGKPEPLVFHTPQVFFECLMERLLAPSIGVRRRRLPNQVTTFTRRSAPPLGTFYNYTWHITNILHAKAIFDTPLMVLNVTRSFVQNPDGTYDDFDPTTPDDGLIAYPRKEGEPNIRPLELKTYLKIGKTSPEQATPSFLSIDWTPNVLPISRVGELKITFEYGHTHPTLS